MPKYHYKGVSFSRLNIDLQEEEGLPVGIRTGSATQKAMATGRQPTPLDSVALWFTKEGDVETARDYCDKAGTDSVVLRANLADYDVTELSGSVYTKMPVKWVHVEYESKDNTWLPLFQYQGKKLPPDLACVRGNDD